MDNYTFLLSDMDFFTECDPSNLVISLDNIFNNWDLEKCKEDIDSFINQMIDGERYTVYCIETPPQNLIYLIVAHFNFKQQALKAGTPNSLIPQLNCYFKDVNNELHLVYCS